MPGMPPTTFMPQMGGFQPIPMAGGQQIAYMPGMPAAMPGLLPPPFPTPGTVPSVSHLPPTVTGSFQALGTVPPQAVIGEH